MNAAAHLPAAFVEQGETQALGERSYISAGRSQLAAMGTSVCGS
jgi:hypothetical protein